ncbi:hypothetical protein [Aquimarina sp. MMG016]|uniref:hypothetical protein n=1 Tax=Aquimarina sp. MMG016 TaxID=2822690 RepID=UPI001B3A76F2|nr:hypothetical protein [Aquimarina sp. MMG016]MBQ4822051.1 hypothetical protein [Aquimarina sp. MMG016]
MQKIIMCLLFVFIMSGCARNVEPTVENINKIFSSQDFTFEFHKTDGACESLSFRNDYLVYKSNKPTIRREITYEEVLLINDFIQKLVNLHSGELNPEVSPHYIIKNTAYKTVITPDQEDFYFKALIKTLKLK